ncbi:nucleotide exchange factor GrpE [Buchnera aphidicola]|uniref:nucleotide exchange factor GrpE n=1 Tax=Buchnera aphidicola TaxID=9 RepID=UPI00339D82C7
MYNVNNSISKIKKNIKEIPLRTLAYIENIKKEYYKKFNKIKREKKKFFFEKILNVLTNINKLISKISKLNFKDNPKFQGIFLIQKNFLEFLKKNKIKINKKKKKNRKIKKKKKRLFLYILKNL